MSGVPERRATVVTVAAVVTLALVVVLVNALSRDDGSGGTTAAASPSAAAGAAAYAEVVSTAPDDLARSMLSERGAPAPQPAPGALPSGSRDLAGQAEQLAQQSLAYSFVLTSFNLLGSQHSAPGGSAPRFADGVTRTRWAADLLTAYGAAVVGLQEIQLDQLTALDQALGGTTDFWPGTSLGPAGVPQNLMWDTRTFEATWTGQVTIPFVGTLRPQPIVRLRHRDTGRELYVMNVHNSPNGRQSERDQALAIEVAALAELRADGLPVLVVGDFNERDRAYCAVTGGTDLLAANGGSPASAGAGCRPPAAMRIDWIFASPDARLGAYRLDESPSVRRITDHAVISAEVSVP